MKKITRRQVEAWFDPIRKCFAEMRSGEVDSIRGYAVTRLNERDTYARTDYAIEGWLGVLRRVMPSFNVEPMERIKRKLANGVPLTVQEIDDAMRCLNGAVKPLMLMPWQQIKDAVLIEMIQIEFDEMQEAA